jgi:hypothetical protein
LIHIQEQDNLSHIGFSAGQTAGLLHLHEHELGSKSGKGG